MKITHKMMHKQIRVQGSLIRTFFNFKSEQSFIFCQKLIKKFIVGRKSKKINCKETFIRKRNGEKLRICIYKSLKAKENATGVLWIHGGGYAIGAPEQDLGYAEHLINATNCVIISPDYTLSVDAPYPAALHDCYAALLWMKKNAKKLGIREDQ